ncbi:MAG: thiamine diphosphokinase [Candidatus Marinimicrobia bacterium]|nr:thiamine diphosphokinase [Candidatus Neomarinimicrobiota bacterium]
MDRSTRTCIFLNGTPPSKKLIKHFTTSDDLLISADGAYDYLKKYQIEPAVLIGDMDSISIIPENKDIKIIHSRDTESNDLEKSLNYCLGRDLRNIRIFGADGKRIDHAIINFATLSSYSDLLNIEVITNEEYLRFLKPGEYGFSGKRGQRFSLLAIYSADELTIKNAKFPVENDTLHKGSKGLSNAFRSKELVISFQTGSILFMSELKT